MYSSGDWRMKAWYGATAGRCIGLWEEAEGCGMAGARRGAVRKRLD